MRGCSWLGGLLTLCIVLPLPRPLPWRRYLAPVWYRLRGAFGCVCARGRRRRAAVALARARDGCQTGGGGGGWWQVPPDPVGARHDGRVVHVGGGARRRECFCRVPTPPYGVLLRCVCACGLRARTRRMCNFACIMLLFFICQWAVASPCLGSASRVWTKQHHPSCVEPQCAGTAPTSGASVSHRACRSSSTHGKRATNEAIIPSCVPGKLVNFTSPVVVRGAAAAASAKWKPRASRGAPCAPVVPSTLVCACTKTDRGLQFACARDNIEP